MTHSITYKVKLIDIHSHDSEETRKAFMPKKTLSRKDCTMKPQHHTYYNSDMFLGMLSRQHDALTGNKRTQYTDNLPAHITVKDCGFLHEVTIELPATFK